MNKTAALAATAAALFLAGAPALAAHHEGEAKVKCEGVNACKGQSACATANNDCSGKNACKGQGYLEMTQAECDAAKAKAGEKS